MTVTQMTQTNGAGADNGRGTELERRPTGQLLSAISNDLVTLVRQEAELGKQEITEAVVSGTAALAVGSVAGVFGIVALAFGGLAASDALAYLLPVWAARLVVAGALGGVMLMALFVAAVRAKRTKVRPEETLRTAKEDIEWAKAHLKR